jgi:tagaturonate reductase
MIHRMNQTGVFNGRVVVVKPRKGGDLDTLNAQEGVYTLFTRGISDGKEINQHERITSISRGIHPYQDWEAFLQTAGYPEMDIVVSNTTEAGIVYVPTERPVDTCPDSFPAKLTAWLLERFRRLGGTSASGVVVLPCELIDRNGGKLKACVLRHTADWDLGPEFAAWLENDCVFLNTWVDRIVPGYPRDEADSMTAELGVEDRLLCATEVFHLLVIEGPEALKTKLPFHEAGLQVVWTEDLTPYRTRKVGILNGAHTASVLAAYLGGVDTVREMMEDGVFGRFVREVVFEELVPSLPMDRSEVEGYAQAVIERFLNPYIRHELISISLNSVSKWSVRVLPSLKRYVDQTGQIPPKMAFSLAALIAFYKGDLRPDYELRDDESVIAGFRKIWQKEAAADVVHEVLSREDWWKEDLTRIPGLEQTVADQLRGILDKGVRETAANLSATASGL